LWDAYVTSHPDSTLYHLSGWKKVIEDTYGHKTHYLIAIDPGTPDTNSAVTSADRRLTGDARIIGILPLVHLKHLVFGNNLISMPFLDLGGVLADSEEAEEALLGAAVELGNTLGVSTIEIRHLQPELRLSQPLAASWQRDLSQDESPPETSYYTRSHKVRMLLDLPDSSADLMKSFKTKFRTKIRLPEKKGCSAKFGSDELIDQFYSVFIKNMRDLGSPVHSRQLFKNVVKAFPKQTRICVVTADRKPVAAGIIISFKDTVYNPWASSLKEYTSIRPNTLLYWKFLEYACDSGYDFFDFGRSSPDGNTYKFKEQWGAVPIQLHWHFIYSGKTLPENDSPDNPLYKKAISVWQKLPVSATRILGPMIRKHIGL